MVAIGERYDLAAIKRHHPLREVLMARGIALRPGGQGTLKARCPFHDDREPSLLVDERDEHFHCFGCGAHGDVIDFVMRRDGVSFAEACRRLLGSPSSSSSSIICMERRAETDLLPRERRWDRLTLEEQIVMNTAAAIYQRCFWQESQARAYLRERAIPEWVARACAVGYADGHSLEAFLRRHSGLRVARDLGLLRRPDRGDSGVGLREFLADRLVVPEIRGGQCIWFIGRRLDGDPGRPKYLALDGERPVLGYERAAGRREVYLCEGVFDYLTAVAWHLPAFSPCGTALPAQRLGFLARARTVYGVLDGDDAGRAAAERFGEQLGERWRALDLPEGCDLNDLGRRPDGRASFFRLRDAARHIHESVSEDGA
jgi:DNA primase